MNRRLAVTTAVLVAALGCRSTAPETPSERLPKRESPPAAASRATPPTAVDGDPVLARILELEDRRVWDESAFAPLLASPEARLRARAVRAVGRLREPASAALLVALAGDPAVDVRREVAFALGLVGARTALTPLATDADERVATTAIFALGLIADAATLPDFERWLHADTLPRVARLEVIRSLFRYKDARAARMATEFARARDRGVREAAIYALGRGAWPEGREALRRAAGDASSVCRMWAARGLGRIADPADLGIVAQLLRDPEPLVVAYAVPAAGSLLKVAPRDAAGARAAIDGLIAVLQDRSGTVRPGGQELPRLAAEAMGASTRSDFASSLEATIAAGGSLAEEAILALASVAPERLAVAAEALSASSDDGIRAKLAEALGQIPVDAGNHQVLMFLLADASARVRAAAASAVREKEWDEFRAPLIARLDDPDPIVRASAIERLARAKEPVLVVNLGAALERGGMDPENDAVLSAVEAAAGLAPDPVGRSLLERALAMPDPIVRRAAARGLVDAYAMAPTSLPAIAFEPPPGAGWGELAAFSERPLAARIETDRGEMVIRLEAGEAPRTVESFVRLARRHYFDGIVFHRVVPGFVIQSGDPRGDGTGGPGYQIRDELNPLPYQEGSVGMALSGPDTGGSQFFATLARQPHLEAGYTVFGRVISGRDAMHRIARGDRIRTVTIVEGPLAIRPIGPIDADTLLELVPEWRQRPELAGPPAFLGEEMRAAAEANPFEVELVFDAGRATDAALVTAFIGLFRRLPGLDAELRLVAVPDAPSARATVRRGGQELGAVEASAVQPWATLLELVRQR